MYIKSNQIKVYPTAHRTVADDYGANINLEQNIISLSNNITDYNSYILEGLIPTYENSTITVTAGRGVIKGYSLKISKDVEFTNVNLNTSNSYYIYLSLNMTTTDSITTIDGIDNSSNEYTGINLEYSTSLPNDELVEPYLVLGKLTYSAGEWILESQTPNVKFNSQNIQLELNSDEGLNEDNYNGTFKNWLDSYFIIDDGEI